MSGLFVRAGSAIVFVIVMLGGLFSSTYSFFALFGLITLMSLWEFYSLTLHRSTDTFVFTKKILGLIIGIFPYTAVTLFHLNELCQTPLFLVKCGLIFLPLTALIFVFELFSGAKRPFETIGNLFLGVVYIGIPFAMLPFIAIDGANYLPLLIFGMLILTWANDTGAYLIGSMIGKTPLFPRISPNKTWEGSLGGVVVTFIIAWLLSNYVPQISPTSWLIIGGIIAVFGSIGDLVESMLKRSLGVKDSGNLMPGHGGMLDRFDAFMFIIPFVASYLLWIR